jgi:hypothetical protein
MSSRKHDLFQRLRNEWLNILQLLNEIKTQEIECHAIGNWTIFDMLSHLAGWAVWRVNATKELLKTGRTDFSHFTTVGKFNADNVADRVNHTWEQIVQEVEYADEEWIALLNSLSEEEIFVSTHFRSPAWKTLAEWVKIAFDHYAHHARAIIEWRACLELNRS